MNQPKSNTSLQEREFMWFSQKIEHIKSNIEKPLGGILQYTKETGINTSFFPEGINEIGQIEVDNAIVFLKSYLHQFKRLITEVKNSTFLNEVQKNILIGTLKSYCLKIIGFQYAVYIEAEKWGYPLKKEERDQYLKNIEKIENLVYGPKISEKKDEVWSIMNTLDKLYQKNKDKISEEEETKFNTFLNNFPERVKEKSETKEKSKNTLGKINQENFAKVLQKGLNIYNIKSRIIKIKDDIKEIKEENGILYIPGINEATWVAYKKSELEKIYKTFNITNDTLKIKINTCAAIEVNIPDKEINIPSNINFYNTTRVLELLSHEIWTHAFSGTNKEKKFNIESDTYLELQEGVAMLNEKAVSWDIKDISAAPTIHHISTFIGENYDAKDTEELLGIYYKLQGKKNRKTMAKNRTQRVKRFHSNTEKWASRKDVVYWRWMVDVLQYIQNLDPEKEEDIKQLQKEIFGFYIGKLGKDEVKNAKELIEGFDINKSNIILPADIGKILLWMLEKETPEGKWIKITNEKLWEHDIRFKASYNEQNLSYSQKKLLLEMKWFLRESREVEEEK